MKPIQADQVYFSAHATNVAFFGTNEVEEKQKRMYL